MRWLGSTEIKWSRILPGEHAHLLQATLVPGPCIVIERSAPVIVCCKRRLLHALITGCPALVCVHDLVTTHSDSVLCAYPSCARVPVEDSPESAGLSVQTLFGW